MLFVIEGIDGAGKGTLARNLLARAAAAGVDVGTLSFPRYGETRFASLVADYLNGEFGAVAEVPPRFSALLYAGDRFESAGLLHDLLVRHRLVVLDRYVASNAAYHGAKVRHAGERRALIDWIFRTEFELFGLPRPDLTCLLAAPPELADRLVGEKGARDYTDRRRDLHEADRPYLAEVAAVYEGLCDESWTRVAVTGGTGAARAPDEIADEVWTALSQRL